MIRSVRPSNVIRSSNEADLVFKTAAIYLNLEFDERACPITIVFGTLYTLFVSLCLKKL